MHKIIDYEDTCVEIKEFDIARTIYGLHLNEKQEKQFLEAYSKFSSPQNFEENKKYWQTMTKINKTANRIKRKTRRTQEETKEGLKCPKQ